MQIILYCRPLAIKRFNSGSGGVIQVELDFSVGSSYIGASWRCKEGPSDRGRFAELPPKWLEWHREAPNDVAPLLVLPPKPQNPEEMKLWEIEANMLEVKWWENCTMWPSSSGGISLIF